MKKKRKKEKKIENFRPINHLSLGGATRMPLQFLLLISRQGKVRLAKYYCPMTMKERTRTSREMSTKVSDGEAKEGNTLCCLAPMSEP
mgnify:CR=1 FL=1